MSKFQKWLWSARLGLILVMAGYPNGPRHVVLNFRFAFQPCWTEMRDDGYTPADAWATEQSYFEE